MSTPTDYSRGLRLAFSAARTPESALRNRLESTRIHVTADPNLPAITKSLAVLVADLRRLPVDLSIDPNGGTARLTDPVLAALQETADSIDPERPLHLGTAPRTVMHIHLGTSPPSTAAISAVPDGHGVRLRHHGHSYPRLASPGTGLGAVLTAAMLTAEVFKTITGLPSDAYRILPVLNFCPVTLGTEPGTVVSALPRIEDTALIGAGAIGTAIALILELLDTTGSLTVVDPEHFEPPNVTTYSLGTRYDADIGSRKTDLIEDHLPGLDLLKIHGTAQDLIEQIDQGTAPWPRLVLGALDSIQARHDIQRLHADLTLDGSTGGQAGTTLTLHEALPTGPCLRCYYPLPTHTVSAEQRLHDNTGLSLARIAHGDQPLTAADLADLSADQKSKLQPHLGKPVCGLSRLRTLTGYTDDDFRPSASFVAQQAACLIIGALIARTTGAVTGPMRRAEYDTRFGPRSDMTDTRRPTPTCTCQTDTNLIALIRKERAPRT